MNVAQLRRPFGATRLVLRCLGRFRLEAAGGEALQIRTRKARAVLACLAVTGRPMSRDTLAELLWSERAPAQARSSVRQAVFELQHLEASDTPVLAAGREDLAVRPELVVTDLALIRAAAMEGDWSRLAVLLQDSQTGFLDDLEGLDREFDSWLRTERAQEPSRTLETVVAAAERCRADAGPRTALDLLTQVVRLDPLNEEAARTALGLAHELGDRAALHRHFHLLRDRLREDLDAEPSAETIALFKRLANGGAAEYAEEPAGRARPDAAPAPPSTTAAEAPPVKRRQPVPALAVALVLALALAALAALALNPRGSPAGAEPVLVAVLPFEQQPKGDGFIASGLWEHTRAALTRSGAMRVLGRATTASMADQRIAPAEYRKRFGVTHLLEGTVRRTGEQVQVSVSLSQTADGVAVWQAMFTGRMSEPLALQDSIANGIEGRLRGRLAQGGGRRADQIATTPQVLGLYSEARELMNTRRPENMTRAKALLRHAVAADPNYAPAWSLLGAATMLVPVGFEGRDQGPSGTALARSERSAA